MKRSDLPKYETTHVESKVTGRVGSVPKSVSWREQNEVCGYNGKPSRKQVILKDRETGELYLDNLADLAYEPYLNYPEINWGPHSVSYFGDISLEMWVAFPEFPISKWYGRRGEDGYRTNDGKISQFIGWLENNFYPNADKGKIFGSRGGWRIYYCTVYIERLPHGYEAFVVDVENKLAELSE